MAAAPVALANVARQIQNVFERSPLVWCSLPRACFVMPVSLAILVRLIFVPILFFMPKCIFLAIVQSRLVQNIPSYIDIIQLAWWYTTILWLKLLVHHGDICSIVTFTTDLDHWPYSQSSWLLFKNIL